MRMEVDLLCPKPQCMGMKIRLRSLMAIANGRVGHQAVRVERLLAEHLALRISR
jgi:hypothetical protein